jgi:hypothetical protein
MTRRISIPLMLLACAALALVARGDAASSPYDWAKWREFWSFKPVVKPAVPAASNPSWIRNPIDAFILAKLDENHRTPAPEADRDTLVRRVTYDLSGLPPTPEEIRAFRADKSPDAYEKLVDRLLASPHYGEHWGRHWLDVARYVPGRISFPGVKHSRGDQAYRDYVVRAFNSDKPYNRFVTEQLAGDLLPPSTDRQQYFDQITAPAFLSIGGWFDMETDPSRLRLEMIDEQINTTTKGLLGLSVACARCHDHKFDPIPTEDYYSLAGVFRSTKLIGNLNEFWRDGRVRQLRPLAMPDEVAANDAIEKRIDEKKAQLWTFLSNEHERLSKTWKADESKYREAAAKVDRPFVKSIEAEQFDGQDNLRIAQLMKDGKATDVLETQTPGAQWVRYRIELPETAKYTLEALYSTDEGSPVYVQANGTYVTENALNEPTGGWDLKYQRWATLATLELRKGVNFLRLGFKKEGSFPRLDRIRLIGQNKATEDQIAQTAAAAGLDRELLERFVIDPQQPWPTVAGVVGYLDDAGQQRVGDLRSEATALATQIAPHEQVVAVTDEAQPQDVPVHLRGETYAVSKTNVPRGTLRLLDGALSRPNVSTGSSGRLELARWITDPRNPLTARVMVNRIWGWHFGRGIVATPSDFGSRGEPPTHPELLDWLAATFVEQGWSIKQLQRLILTSNTYRMSSAESESELARHTAPHGATLRHISDSAGAERTQIADDPENKLLSRFPRRRLEAEAIYDAMRSTTNMIPRQQSGTPLDREKSSQRAMYILSNGKAPPGLGGDVRKFFGLFDYDLSTAPIAQRMTSQTAAQSLFWMNSPLVKFMAGKFAERLLRMDKLDDPKRVDMAYLLALGHEPSPAVKKSALAFLEQAVSEDGKTSQEAWSELCQALYGSAEFRYLE